MALKIDTVEVRDFLDIYPVKMMFDAETNFVIGLNGTGKTTFINLLRACLECDSVALVGLPFRSIDIKFRNTDGRNKPVLSVVQTKESPSGSPVVEYTYREKSTSQPLQARFVYDRGAGDETYGFVLHARSFHREEGVDQIKECLPSVVWLSIYRGSMARPEYITQEAANPIDRKINDIVVNTTKYLSSSDKSYSALLESFQKSYFLSLLNTRLTSPEEAYQYDLDAEQRGINEISVELFKETAANRKSIVEHFSKAKKSIESYKTTGKLKYSDAVNIADTIRLHKLVDDWRALQEKKDIIYKQKSIFEQIMSDMLVNKKLGFNARNQPIVSPDGNLIARNIELKDLSSGEKQLFIIFGSALIQEDREFIFLADEPELSLHIEWQRMLVSNLRTLNKNAQLIFATHSPDIVAEFSKHVIKMEAFVPRMD